MGNTAAFSRAGEYTIENSNGRVVVRGSVPVEEFSALSKAWKKRGLDTLALGVCASLGATIAICNKKDLAAWEEEVKGDAERKAKGDAELEWLLGTDTGTSSKTIFSVLAKPMLGVQALASLRHWGADVPHDPDDFGRCYRLLEKFPAWRSRLSEVAAKFPKYGPMVREWDQMESLWREELPTGRCPKLYDLMQRLQKEAGVR